MSLVDRAARVTTRIAAAAQDAGRDPGDIQVLLAAKTQSAETIRDAIHAGYRLLGHNRVQELTATESQLTDVPHEVHMIGRLQSNKVAAALRWVSCVQSVDTERLATRLDRTAATRDRPLEVFVQVNTSGEETKGGTAPSAAVDLCAVVGRLQHLRLRGLMTIGANAQEEQVVRRSYRDLADLRDAVVGSGAPGTSEARELSMGMSGDLEWAIAEGATMVRIGTAVFGPRR